MTGDLYRFRGSDAAAAALDLAYRLPSVEQSIGVFSAQAEAMGEWAVKLQRCGELFRDQAAILQAVVDELAQVTEDSPPEDVLCAGAARVAQAVGAMQSAVPVLSTMTGGALPLKFLAGDLPAAQLIRVAIQVQGTVRKVLVTIEATVAAAYEPSAPATADALPLIEGASKLQRQLATSAKRLLGQVDNALEVRHLSTVARTHERRALLSGAHARDVIRTEVMDRLANGHPTTRLTLSPEHFAVLRQDQRDAVIDALVEIHGFVLLHTLRGLGAVRLGKANPPDEAGARHVTDLRAAISRAEILAPGAIAPSASGLAPLSVMTAQQPSTVETTTLQNI